MSVEQIKELFGKTFSKVEKGVGKRDGNDAIFFRSEEGNDVLMTHDQDCCESVCLEDITGDLSDLEGSPITLAYATSNSGDDYGRESETWTFYHLATIKGYVTLRWYGTSNGYYSESVDLYEVNKDESRIW